MWYLHLHHIQIKNIYFKVKCRKFYMLEDYHIDLLESHWVVICLQYMILILNYFSHENAYMSK
jgi:hypothetical protein